jgi:hypothetical protein
MDRFQALTLWVKQLNQSRKRNFITSFPSAKIVRVEICSLAVVVEEVFERFEEVALSS